MRGVDSLQHRMGGFFSRPSGVRVGVVALALVGLICGVAVARAAIGPAPGPADGTAIRWGLPPVRALYDALGITAVGLCVLTLLLPTGGRRAAAARISTARAIIGAGVLWTAAALVVLWLQVAQATGMGPMEVPASRFDDYIESAAAGRALLVAGCAGLAFAATGVVTILRPGSVSPALAAVPAGLGVLALPVTGHASTADAHEAAVLGVGVHIVAAAVWVGGLGATATLLGRQRELLVTVLPRYSRLAVGCLLVVIGTGLLSAVLRLPDIGSLVDTGYGAVVLGKASGAIVLAVLGVRARLRLLPDVLARRPRATVAWLAVEVTVMAIVVGLAAVLAASAPPT